VRPVPRRIIRPLPPIGGKVWLLQEKGIFILEEGAGSLITIACTHAGSGSLHVIDGIPDENGFFPELVPDMAPADAAVAPGVEFYRANPNVMGSWMLNGGFIHGLTVMALGGFQQVAPVATIVWMPFKRA
jgi:hypothetical protein